LPKNEDGEFELILGNRQLMSVFFIVVILLGVFFTMGYIVGRNSAPATAEVASIQKAESKPLVAESAAKPAETAPVAAPTETTPQQPESAEPAPGPEKEEPAKTARTKAAAPERSSRNRPIPGQSYLQLAATTQHEADIMVDVLRKKGFKSLAAEIDEKPGTFRVLVGPVADRDTGYMRTKLQSAGFPGNAAIRRTF
jgi:cell division septation protein DedD